MKAWTIAALLIISSFAFSGEISDYYHTQPHDKVTMVENSIHYEMSSTNHGITEIGIERSGCLGTCPSYTFILKSDGTFRYKGVSTLSARASLPARFRSGLFTTLLDL